MESMLETLFFALPFLTISSLTSLYSLLQLQSRLSFQGTSLVVQRLIITLHAGDADSISVWETKIPHTTEQLSLCAPTTKPESSPKSHD